VVKARLPILERFEAVLIDVLVPMHGSFKRDLSGLSLWLAGSRTLVPAELKHRHAKLMRGAVGQSGLALAFQLLEDLFGKELAGCRKRRGTHHACILSE
jgi:hypothetical protein